MVLIRRQNAFHRDVDGLKQKCLKCWMVHLKCVFLYFQPTICFVGLLRMDGCVFVSELIQIIPSLTMDQIVRVGVYMSFIGCCKMHFHPLIKAIVFPSMSLDEPMNKCACRRIPQISRPAPPPPWYIRRSHFEQILPELNVRKHMNSHETHEKLWLWSKDGSAFWNTFW